MLASLMFATHSEDARDGLLVCNELSAPRRTRLRRVLEEYLPEPVRECVRVTNHDGTKWGRYGAVLLDGLGAGLVDTGALGGMGRWEQRSGSG